MSKPAHDARVPQAPARLCDRSPRVTQLGEQLGDLLHLVALEAAEAAAAKVLAEARAVLAAPAPAPAAAGPAEREEMTTADVCTFFSIDPKTLWEWRRDPDAPFPAPRRMGANTLRYLRAEVNAWRAARPVAVLRRARPVSRIG